LSTMRAECSARLPKSRFAHSGSSPVQHLSLRVIFLFLFLPFSEYSAPRSTQEQHALKVHRKAAQLQVCPPRSDSWPAFQYGVSLVFFRPVLRIVCLSKRAFSSTPSKCNARLPNSRFGLPGLTPVQLLRMDNHHLLGSGESVLCI
jgi:hypothetical protein